MKVLFDFIQTKVKVNKLNHLHIILLSLPIIVIGIGIEVIDQNKNSLQEPQIIKAYVDPNLGVYMLVTILGAIASVGYFCKSFLFSIKNKLLGEKSKPKNKEKETGLPD